MRQGAAFGLSSGGIVSTGFSTQDVTGMLGVTPSRLRAYVRAGLLCPQRGQSGELRFSFQDLLLLRTAEGLVTERLPPRRVRDALRNLRRILPTSQPLTGVHLENEGGHVIVHDGERAWRADSGQFLMTFEASPLAPTAASPATTEIFARRPTADSARPPPVASDFFQLAGDLEDNAPEQARVAYEQVLAMEPNHVEAHVNLGRLLHNDDELPAAEAHYRAAIALRPDDVTALFNLGVLLEDRGQFETAIATYEAATALDARHADAHFNAARLHDEAGHYEAALRHLRAYRNLTRR
ncbi:MAG TPA: tetratricopeptide repeat protein [Polyangia bacterium]|jgi:tetratricopeptide (TPR) repeat protein